MLFTSIKIAIVDDHALFRKMLKTYLSEQKNLQVSIQASDIFDLLNKLKDTEVDVLLMDIFMPGMNGDEALKSIRNQYPSIRIIVLSMSHDLELVSDLLEAGIHGYVSKAEEPDELIQAIHAVAEGRIYRNKLFTEALYHNKQNNIKRYGDKYVVELNEREKKIITLIWQEKSNKEIADELFLGVRSVEKIRQDIKEKIGTRSTVGLLKYAIHRKIVGLQNSEQHREVFHEFSKSRNNS